MVHQSLLIRGLQFTLREAGKRLAKREVRRRIRQELEDRDLTLADTPINTAGPVESLLF